MTHETLEALKNSIAHWERLASGTGTEYESPYVEHCDLCKEFLKDSKCTGCPVALATGHNHCVGSPWEKAGDAWIEHGRNSSDFLNAAAIQLAFLKSLLPKETT